jgi:hypothetical protein
VRDAFTDLIPLIHVDTVDSGSVLCFRFKVGRPCRTGALGTKAFGVEYAPGVVGICVDTAKAGPMPVAISVVKTGAETALVGLNPFYIQSPLIGTSFRSFHAFWEAACKTMSASGSQTSLNQTSQIATSSN